MTPEAEGPTTHHQAGEARTQGAPGAPPWPITLYLTQPPHTQVGVLHLGATDALVVQTDRWLSREDQVRILASLRTAFPPPRLIVLLEPGLALATTAPPVCTTPGGR